MKFGETDIPRAEERRAEQLEMLAPDEDDADGHGPEHPLVGVRGEEIDMVHAERRRAERLDGIEGKKDPAPAQQPADGIHIDAVTAEEIARGERDQPGAFRERGLDERRRDLPGPLRVQVADLDAAAGQFHPGIDIRGVIVRVAEQFVPFAPREAVGEEAEAQRGRAEQRDLIRLRADEIGARRAAPR